MARQFVARITIERYLDDDDDWISVIQDDGNGGSIPMIEALGMLEMARDDILHPDQNETDDGE